ALQDPRAPPLARRFLAYAVALGPSDPAGVAQAYLHAAWVCDDAGRADQAAGCRRRAAGGFRRLPPFADTEPGVTTAAVLVDALRRSGQLGEAAAECGALLAYRSATGTVRGVLEHQQRLIAHSDTAAHPVSECERVSGPTGKKPWWRFW